MSARSAGAGQAGHELSRHVPRIALDWVVDTPERRWRLVRGSMVFADISGFTALSERLARRGRIGAEELVETLSRVFGGMLDTAAERGGQLLKFGGDALLFLFEGGDHVAQACATAVEMRRALRRAAEIVTSVGRLSLSISIGVHSGDFHLFLVGEPSRELVVLGPGIGRVVECENTAEAGEIVVSETTAEILHPSSVRLRADGARLLRWRKPPVAPVGGAAARPTDPDAARRLMPPILRGVLDGARPDPAHRVATISFMRFTGTDEMLEADGPDHLAAALDETLRRIQAVFRVEDIALLCVDCDVGGGKVFCSAGVPLASEDDEGRMLRAARAIVASDLPLPLQIGINRGHVFAAEVGTRLRAAFSAMGDTTNTAARICGKAAPGTIYVHPSVLDHARTLYDAVPVGPFRFKGKVHPQLLYQVGEEIGPRVAEVDRELPMLGRADARARLRAALAAAGTGDPGAVVVTGGVGTGKSRLVREVLAEGPGRDLLAVHAEPYGSNSAYRVFRDPLRAALGIERGEPAAMADALRRAVRGLVPGHEPLLGLVGDVLQITVEPSREVAAIVPRYRPDRTADVVIDLLDAMLPGGLVITVEDAHWADDASSHLIDRLARAAADRPWTVIVVRRDAEGGADLEAAERIALAPLGDDSIRALALAATEGAPLRPHEVDQIVARAAGNPLFAVELVRARQEVGSLDAVPVSLQGAIAAQVDALEPLARRVLSYASVLGRSFRRQVLAEVLRDEGIEIDPATIERLGRFVEPDGEHRMRFRSGLLRDVTYDGLGFHLRARLHREAGHAIERLSEDAVADADTLALHFSAAGDHARTYTYAVVAAERAERAHAPSDAASHLERALDAARRRGGLPDDEIRGLWVRLGDARDHAGLLGAALDAYRQAARHGGDELERSELMLRRAHVRERAAAFPAALREATIVRRRLQDRADREACVLRARAAAFSAVVRQRQEHAVEAARLARAARAEAEACGDRAALARACGVIAWAGLVLGGDDSVRHARRALELFEELDDLVGQAHMANNLGGYAYFRGEWSETLAWYARCEDACRRMGNVTDAALTQANTGEVLVSQGRLAEAEPLLRDAARVLRASGHLWGAAFAEMHLARLLVAGGDLGRAEGLLRACVEENAAIGSAASAYEAALHLAECLVRAGRPQEALDVVAGAAARTVDDIAIFDGSSAHVRALALLEMERADEALETIVEGVAFARARGLEFDLARLLLLAARVAGPVDPRLGTDDPRAEARRLLARLDVVAPLGR